MESTREKLPKELEDAIMKDLDERSLNSPTSSSSILSPSRPAALAQVQSNPYSTSATETSPSVYPTPPSPPESPSSTSSYSSTPGVFSPVSGNFSFPGEGISEDLPEDHEASELSTTIETLSHQMAASRSITLEIAELDLEAELLKWRLMMGEMATMLKEERTGLGRGRRMGDRSPETPGVAVGMSQRVGG